AMLPADDVLARARERVQSRAAPSLRQLMYDAPRPPPPPPLPLPGVATSIPPFGDLAVQLPQLGAHFDGALQAPNDRFGLDDVVEPVSARSPDEATPMALGEMAFPQVTVDLATEPEPAEVTATADANQASDSDVAPDSIDHGDMTGQQSSGPTGDAGFSGEAAAPISTAQTSAIDEHLGPLLVDGLAVSDETEPSQARPLEYAGAYGERAPSAPLDSFISRSFYPPTSGHNASPRNAPSAGFIPRLERIEIPNFEDPLSQTPAFPINAAPAWNASDAPTFGLPTFATNRPIPIQPPPIPQPPPGTRFAATVAPPGSFEPGSRFPPMDNMAIPNDRQQRVEPAFPNFGIGRADAAVQAAPRFAPSVPGPGQHHLPNAQPGVFEASLPSLASAAEDFEFPQPPMPGPQLGFPSAPLDAAPAAMKPRGRSPTTVQRHATETSPGLLAENIPRTMRVAQPERIEIRIAKASITGITTGKSGGTIWQHDITVTQAMSVRLRAPEGGFFIETVSPETMWIENQVAFAQDDFASWRFIVTPQTRGRAPLQIVVSARVTHDGVAADTALPDQIIDVQVRANITRSLGRSLGWIVAAIMGGALAKFGESGINVAQSLMTRFMP
ncbi:MAG: hypothetical protein K2X41_04640, partial [Hyphomicrobium sp.]|nr:hypothetical protein [Hyphomicrobium sp.]